MKNSIILAFTLLALTSSCKKDLFIEQSPTPSDNVAKVDKFNKIKTSDAFNWESTKLIDFTVSGMSDMTGISNTLKVTNVAGDVEYLKVKLSMSDNFQSKISIPSNVKLIKVSYGSITKIYNPQTGSVKFDYIIDVAE
jgi:hypothetical protein